MQASLVGPVASTDHVLATSSTRLTWLRPTLLVFIPFAAGYHLSYLFRVINAVIAEPLVREVSIDATGLGFLSAVYFLTFAAMQIPIGAALDRYGSRLVQATLLIVAACGAAIFASASSFTGLLLGRGLIGLGVAGSLVAGLKAIVDWFPKDRLPLANGAFIAIGASGAICATAPAEWIVARCGWRGLFMLMAGATALVALAIFFIVPEQRRALVASTQRLKMRAIYSDPRFWQLAPLSALCIGSAWALQGLWAAPWLTDVANLDRAGIVQHLFVMACALCVSALLMGIVADRLWRCGAAPRSLLVFVVALFILAELSLALGVPLPTVVMWSAITGMGAATVLSYGILAEIFPGSTGRANAALNLLHIGSAFVIQSAIGLILGLWPRDDLGHYPPVAYHAAFLLLIILQLAGLWSFVRRHRPITLHS